VADSGFAFVLYEILAAAGLSRGFDYRVVELGSTPRRLNALLSGGCAATMLNAGSDLRAADAGCPRLRRAVDVCHPYLGTVLAALGSTFDDARLAGLARALRGVLGELRRGERRELAEAEAAAALGLDRALAASYVDTLGDAAQGLVADGVPDDAALTTVVELRRRYAGEDSLAPLGPPYPGLVDRRFLPAASAPPS
jgi:hypothetical protein